MSKNTREDFEIQQAYYARTASLYNAMHADEENEQLLALSFLASYINDSDCTSLLDIGSGTGKKLLYLKTKCPKLKVLGIEPSKELREVAYQSGLSSNEIQDGNGLDLDFNDGAFDIVCEFNTLHHIRNPEVVVSEMLRVAKKAVFIFDLNNFGSGSKPARLLKQLLNDVGLWSLFDLIKTGGKGYRLSEGDGLSYSYSVFNNYDLIRKNCQSLHLITTINSGINPYRSSTQIGILGIK